MATVTQLQKLLRCLSFNAWTTPVLLKMSIIDGIQLHKHFSRGCTYDECTADYFLVVSLKDSRRKLVVRARVVRRIQDFLTE